MVLRHPPGRVPFPNRMTNRRSPAFQPRCRLGVVVNVRGVAYVIQLPPRDHARPALWRELEDWRGDRSASSNGEPEARQD